MAGARIQLKRATASSWSSSNPVLYAGEIGYETDTNKFKIGDGTTAYNSLAYFNGNLASSSLNDLADVAIVSAANGDFLRWNGTAWVNDAVNLSTDTIGDYVQNLVAGTGVSLTNNSGEGSTPTIAIGQSVATDAIVTFDTVNANLVGNVTGNADTATALETSRTIELSGDVTGSASFDGSSNINIVTTVVNDGIELGTNTTGDYVESLVAGTGVSLADNSGEGATPTISIGQSVGTSDSPSFAGITADSVTVGVTDSNTISTSSGDLTVQSAGGTVTVNDNLVVNGSIAPSVGSGANGIEFPSNPGGGGSDIAYIKYYVESGENTRLHIHNGDNEDDDIYIEAHETTVTNNLTVGGAITVGGDIIPEANENYDLGSPAARFRDIYLSGTTIDLGGAEITSDGTDISFSGAINVGVGSNFVGDLTGNADTATALETSRTIELQGDVAGSASFNGASNAVITATIQPNSVALGADTTGNYVQSLVAGTGVTLSNNSGESATPTIAIGQAVETTSNVTFNDVNVTGNLTVSGTTTSINTETLTVDDNIIVLNNNATGAPTQNAGIQVERGSSSNVELRWNETTDSWEITEDGTTYKNIAVGQDVETTSSVTFASVNADVTGDLTGNADTATALETSRTIELQGDVTGSASFDGTANAVITATIAANSVALGTDTTGDYVQGLVAGTGVTLANNSGEGSTPTISIGQSVATNATVTFDTVNADLVGDVTGNADTATALENSRTIELQGDVTGSASFDGTANAVITATISANSVALGTDTTGNYVSDVQSGTAISVTHTPGEGSTATVALNASLNDLNDVVVSAPAEFQALAYDGIGWVPTYTPVVSYVRNAEATTIATGTAVYLFGGNGDHASVKRAGNASEATSSKTIGLVGAPIAANQNGPVVTRGYVDGIDLSAYSTGDVLWLGENGQVTTTKPQAPLHMVFIGVVVRATNNGIVYVAVQNGYELNELHDVKTNGKVDKDVLMWNSASAVWVNEQINLGTDTVGDYVQNLVAGTGVTLTNNSGEGSTPTVAIGQAVGTTSNVQFADVEATGDLTVGGDLFVSGTFTTINETSLSIDDPFIYLNSGSTETNPDLGIAGNYNDGTYRHAGMFRDASDGKFKFFDSYTPEPSHPINTAHASYSPAPVVAETFESTVSTGTAPLTVSSTTEVANLHAATSTALHTSRTIELQGDVTGSASFDGTSNATITASIAANSVVLGTDTTGNYMSDVTAGTGISVSHAQGEGSTATITNTGVTSINGSTGAVTGIVTTSDTGTVTSAMIADGTIVNSDINASAAIELSKLASGTSAQVIIANASGVPTYTTLSGDVTVSDTGVVSISANSVALGTDTTGNYMVDVSSGTGISVSHTQGEGSTATVSLNATLDDLSNVSASAPSDGQFLKYVTASSAWVPAAIPTINNLDDIGDVTITSATSGNFLKWNGTAWVNDVIDLGTDTTGNYVSDVTAGTGVTVTHTPGEGSSPTIAIGQAVGTSASVTFAHVSAPVTGNVTGDVSGNAGTATVLQTSRQISLGGELSGSASFNGSSDITINATIQSPTVTASETAPASPAEGDLWLDSTTLDTFVRYDSAWVQLNDSGSPVEVLNDLFDVDVSEAQPNQFLKYDGTDWIPASPVIPTTINTKTSNYSLVVADAGKIIETNISTPNTLTVPTNSNQPIPIGSRIEIIQYGSGKTQITGDTGVTIRSLVGYYITGQYGQATLVKRTSNEWILFGDLSSS